MAEEREVSKLLIDIQDELGRLYSRDILELLPILLRAPEEHSRTLTAHQVCELHDTAAETVERYLEDEKRVFEKFKKQYEGKKVQDG